MRKCDVLAVGANSVDFVYRVPAPPQLQGPFAKMRIGRHLISCGGQATTMLATIAAMGLRGKDVGVTGNDDNGERIRRELTLLGLDIADVIVRDVPNPHAVILVDEVSGERMVLWDRDDDLRERACGIPPRSGQFQRVSCMSTTPTRPRRSRSRPRRAMPACRSPATSIGGPIGPRS